MALRRKLVIGNWKMNGSLAALSEIGAIAEAARGAAGVDVGLCPPFTLIAAAATRAGGLMIGSQDVHAGASGAHTGCISAAMIREAGGRLAIVGHSERRAEQQEKDSTVRAKAEAALGSGLMAIICVGESEAQRAAGEQLGVVAKQMKGSLPDEWDGAELVLAYEPIWAIGTGKVAGVGEIAEMHAAIRNSLSERFGERGGRLRILYGGSVKADNARKIFAISDVDGALVGGASLSADQFVPIVEAAAAH